MLAREIAATDRKLEELETEIDEVGEPASHELRHRLEMLKIEERALKRNFGELLRARVQRRRRLRKVQTLLHHIEKEERSLEQEADFLHQSAPTTLEVAARSCTRVFDIGARGVHRVLGDRQIMWHSPFVNTTYEALAARFELPPPDVEPD